MATLQELCALVDGELRGPDDLEITGLGSLDRATSQQIAPIDSIAYRKLAEGSVAGAFLTRADIADGLDTPCIVHSRPLYALNVMMESFGLVKARATGVHRTAVIDGDVHESVAVGAFAVIEAGATVGRGTVLGAHCVIESGATIGEDCTIEPGAVLYEGAEVGNRVRIGAHAVISRAGFGFTPGPNGPVHLHHVGRVVIEDDAYVGACAMIDRARFDDTRIGTMAAVDNLVQVAHNCRVGARSFLAAQVGLAGNSEVGNDCEVGGQAGFGNGVSIGDGSRVGAQAGVIKSWPEKSDLLWSPATPRRIVLRKLGQLLRSDD